MNERDVDRLLAGLVPAPPPTETRHRALAAARAAKVLGTEPEDAWSRLWRSRPVRLAWAATVVALLLAHALLSVRGPAPAGVSVSPAHLANQAEAEAELAAIAELPPLRLGVLPFIDPLGRPPVPSINPSTPSPRRPS